jgi:hypothetical protein
MLLLLHSFTVILALFISSLARQKVFTNQKPDLTTNLNETKNGINKWRENHVGYILTNQT